MSLVGAGQFASSAAAEVGVLVTVLGLLASINVFIGIFNILPFPPLDGGHLAVLGVETGGEPGPRACAAGSPTTASTSARSWRSRSP